MKKRNIVRMFWRDRQRFNIIRKQRGKMAGDTIKMNGE